LGKLFAGVATRNISPSPEILKLLKEDGKYAYESIFKHLYMRVLVLTDGKEKFVYFGSDLSYFNISDEVCAILKKELGLEKKDSCSAETAATTPSAAG